MTSGPNGSGTNRRKRLLRPGSADRVISASLARRPPKQTPCEALRSVKRCGFVRRSLIAVLLHVNIDELIRRTTGFQEIPALHPIVGALQFIRRDRRRIDKQQTAFAQIADL